MKYNAKRIFDRFLKSSLSKQEELELDLFEKEMMYHNSNKIFQGEQHEKQVEYEMLSKITSGRKKVKTIYKIMAAASIVILFTTIGALNFNKQTNIVPTEIANNTNSNRTYILSDGSEITLKSGSKISYNEEFNREKREIELFGEAFFDIKRNEEKPFIISTGKLKTQVLGTSFNIKEDNTKIKVTVLSGLVKVYDKENSVNIRPNQQAEYNVRNENISTKNINSGLSTLWMTKEVRLQRISFLELADYLEERFGVKVHFEDVELKNKRLTTNIQNTDDLESIIKRINYLKELNIKKNSNTLITISK